MAGRLDYAVSVSPVQQGSDLEGTTPEAVEADIGRSLGGGNSSLSWDSTLVGSVWSAGTHSHVEGKSTSPPAVAANGDDGVWIRHTGKNYDATKTGNIDDATANVKTVTIKVGSTSICTLGKDDCIFLPKPLGAITVVGADDTGPAIEYAQFQ